MNTSKDVMDMHQPEAYEQHRVTDTLVSLRWWEHTGSWHHRRTNDSRKTVKPKQGLEPEGCGNRADPIF